MLSIKTRATNFALTAAAVAAMGLGLFGATGQASAAQTDGPWPEPPSCSNETLSCTSIADQLAYECFFEDSDWPITWCDDPVTELEGQHTRGLVAGPEVRSTAILIGMLLPAVQK